MKRFFLTILLMSPLLVFCQPASQGIADLYNMSFGRYGCLNISDTSAHTGKWGAFQADTSTVVEEAVIWNLLPASRYYATARWGYDTITNWHLPAGIVKFWPIKKIKLSSGRGTLYNEKP